jgi:PHD/YefM family antitoxin component YafN of YafNO toxin-antitoxin module
MSELKMEGRHESMWVTISTDEYESMKATIETLSDPEIMEQIRKSEADIKAGKTKKWDNFVKEIKNKS